MSTESGNKALRVLKLVRIFRFNIIHPPVNMSNGYLNPYPSPLAKGVLPLNYETCEPERQETVGTIRTQQLQNHA